MNKEFLHRLLTTPSVSGCEAAVEKTIYDYMQDKADSVTADELGNVYAVINPDKPCQLLMTGHADEIGLMITAVTSSGMLKVTNIGGIYPTVYPGQKVRIHTEKGTIYGAVVNTRDLAKKSGLSASDLTIDIGAESKEEALAAVSLGDTITPDTDYRELLHNKISSRALDDKAGAFIIMEALAEAKRMGAVICAAAASTTGEETTMNGAYFTASRLHPRMAIAVDVTYTSDYPGTDEAETGDVRLGLGPVICNNPSIHKVINKKLYEAAEEAGIPVQTEAANGRTGTDGDTIHKTGIGVPFALVSIPLRYMHCPDETASYEDIENCIKLLAHFICKLTEDTSLALF